MKIPWPGHYRWIDKTLASFAAVMICITYVAGFIVLLWIWLGD